jgi:uncharacterized repeat protein (TIGR03803 family)
MQIFGDCVRILGGAFLLSLSVSAQTFTTLYNFGSQDYDGAFPSAGVIRGPRGELYGTTDRGGEWNDGTVYELLPPASPGGAWTELVLHSFNGQDGAYPLAGLRMGPRGELYGVASQSTGGDGAVFELDPPAGASAQWLYTVIYRFTDLNGNPSGGLVFGPGRSLYGVAQAGDGNVYSLTPPSAAGGAWIQSTVYSFAGGSSGWDPFGTLAVGIDGTLFGVTRNGGRPFPGGGGGGTVYSLTPPAESGGSWTWRLHYAFNEETGDGAQPMAGVIVGPGGVLYGTTTHGGGGGWGTVFALTPVEVSGVPMKETILYSFTGTNGSDDGSSLVLGPSGVLYGTTYDGGANGCGMVFQLAPPASPGGSWSTIILYSFEGGADGFGPNGPVLGPDGTLYGTTENAGAHNNGTVFSVTP